MMQLIVRNNFEEALRIFRRACSPILSEVKDRAFYLSPSEKRRKKNRRAMARAKKKMRAITRMETRGV